MKYQVNAEAIYKNADSTAFNHHTREFFARKGDKGAVIPEGKDGEPDFSRAVVTPLASWASQDW